MMRARVSTRDWPIGGLTLLDAPEELHELHMETVTSLPFAVAAVEAAPAGATLHSGCWSGWRAIGDAVAVWAAAGAPAAL